MKFVRFGFWHICSFIYMEIFLLNKFSRLNFPILWKKKRGGASGDSKKNDHRVDAYHRMTIDGSRAGDCNIDATSI
ncbi:MAG: hypothetical protein LBD10_06150 [Desulfobulbus sp.]|jgi:hypothetical protein|uniref:hypothetical protein n=1 Tax=Desulfobulbus sp. TaxID=895 RepID=UPI00283CBB94|nr:hypothetical protein [Desulfobulbus sp.]MDR2549760.1 hypothetical protein [Desulfobulbus sp.]